MTIITFIIFGLFFISEIIFETSKNYKMYQNSKCEYLSKKSYINLYLSYFLIFLVGILALFSNSNIFSDTFYLLSCILSSVLFVTFGIRTNILKLRKNIYIFLCCFMVIMNCILGYLYIIKISLSLIIIIPVINIFIILAFTIFYFINSSKFLKNT